MKDKIDLFLYFYAADDRVYQFYLFYTRSEKRDLEYGNIVIQNQIPLYIELQKESQVFYLIINNKSVLFRYD